MNSLYKEADQRRPFFFLIFKVYFFFEPDIIRNLVKLGMLSLSWMKRLGRRRQSRALLEPDRGQISVL